jgi:excisionase family DNA binding protein
MQWMSIAEYAELTGLQERAIHDLIESGKLTVTRIEGKHYIDPSKGVQSVIPTQVEELVAHTSDVVVGPQFVEKTIGTIMNLHEKVLDAKDETIESIRNENLFLKEALASLQELYDEDRRTIETLTDQLKHAQNEVEFMRRKYKLMWGRVVDEYADSAPGKKGGS